MRSAELESAAEAIEAQAAYWLDRVHAPDIGPKDRVAFEKWKREDPSHKDAYERLERGNAFADQFMNDPKILAMVEEARRETQPPVWKLPAIQFGAVAALLLGISIPVSMRLIPTQDTAPVIATASNTISYSTQVGERSTVTLSDGSVVTLNTDSELAVEFTGEARNVDLLRGQAYFEVAKDITRPFVVEAGDKRVVALGTAFDVRFRDAGRVEVTLVEGLVEVDLVDQGIDGNNTGAAVPALKPEMTKVSLQPGERLVASLETVPEITKPDIEDEISWREGLLVFRDRPLSEVVSEMNRYSTQKMKLDSNPELEAIEVSGVFNTGRASTFVTALEAMHPLEGRRTGINEVTLLLQN